MADYMKENKCSEDHYNLVCSNPDTCPKDTPKMKKNLIKSEFVKLVEIKE